MSRARIGLLTLLCLAQFGCPETVEILEEHADGPALDLDAPNASQRYRLTVETPEAAYPGPYGYSERVRIALDVATDLEAAGEVSISLLAANIDDMDDDARQGMLKRSNVYFNDTHLELELSLGNCGEATCIRTVDIDFIKSGEGSIDARWHVEHTIDWHGDENGNPPVDAVSILSIARTK